MSATPTIAPPQPNQALILLRGVGGAIAGAIAGYAAFYLLWRNGFYGIMVIGALIGFGSSLASRARLPTLGIICAVLAFPVSVLAEWHVMPFINDKSLSFFVANLSAVHWLFIGLGTAAAYWFGQGR